jgi:hypothetical protein
LSGEVAPQDAPPGYESIADAIQQALHSGPAGAARRERATVAAMVQTLRASPPLPELVPTRRKIARARGVKVAAIAAAVVLGATAAGAATNSLPGPVQRAISDTVSYLGVSLPKPTPPRAGTPGGPNAAARPGNPVGPNAAARDELGLCRAYASGPSTTSPQNSKGDSVAFANLKEDAHAAGMSVADYCKKTVIPTRGLGPAPKTVTTLSGGTSTTTTAVSTQQPAGPPISTEHSPGPPVSTEHPTGPPATEHPTGPPATKHPTGPPATKHPTRPPVTTKGNGHRP